MQHGSGYTASDASLWQACHFLLTDKPALLKTLEVDACLHGMMSEGQISKHMYVQCDKHMYVQCDKHAALMTS